MRKFSSMYTEHGRSSRAHGSEAGRDCSRQAGQSRSRHRTARATPRQGNRTRAGRVDGVGDVKKRAPHASGRPAERAPPAERRDRPVRHAPQTFLERPRDAEEFGIIKAVEQHATWNHGPREDHGRW